MLFREVQQDLLTVPQGYMLAHCISADFALGAGVAKKINEQFNMRAQLRAKYDNAFVSAPCCLVCMNVFNLVTKDQYWGKPTLSSITSAIKSMRDIALSMGIKKIAMPKIGCGLDRLNWQDVSQIIVDVFNDTDIEIMVCCL